MPTRVILICSIVAAARLCFAQTTDQQIVDRFFPQRVLDDYTRNWPGETPDRQTAFVAADLDGAGQQNYLVAAYSAGNSDTLAAVRVLRKQGDSAVVVAEPDFPWQGREPEISSIDVDHSGRPQFLVAFAWGIHVGMAQTVLRWNGTGMEMVGPVRTESDGPVPGLTDGDFVDLDGDGVLEAVNPPGTSYERELLVSGKPYTVYKLSGGLYTQSDVIFDFFYGFFESDDIEFAVADPSQPHILTIVNGDGRAQGPVASAEIRLNGVLVAGPNRINQKMRTLRIPVRARAKSTLRVTVTRKGDSILYVGIGPENRPNR